MNGENLGLNLSKKEAEILKTLSDCRQLSKEICVAIGQDLSESPAKLRQSKEALRLALYDMYIAGWIVYH